MKRFKVFAVTVCGIHRSVNEDNIFVNGFYKEDVRQKDASYYNEFSEDDYFISAVFDGLGGHRDGEEAALRACEAVNNKMTGRSNPEMMISAANEAICKYNKQNITDSGSTCVMLESNNGSFRSWNVGDSRAYKIHDSDITRLSVDHVAYTVDSRASDVVNKSNRSLSQHLGIESDDFIIEPYVSEWEKSEEGDVFLLCSDGLCGAVSDDDILRVVSSKIPIRDMLLSLLKLSIDKRSRDNISVILIQDSGR